MISYQYKKIPFDPLLIGSDEVCIYNINMNDQIHISDFHINEIHNSEIIRPIKLHTFSTNSF